MSNIVLKPELKSPIQVLANNILHAFENIDPSAINIHLKAVKEGLIQKQIELDYERENFKTPQVTSDGLIKLNAVYLDHLWSFIYSTFVIFEEGVQKPQINKTFNGVVEFNTPLLVRARSLYIWSLSLPKQITDWDMSLPNPANYIDNIPPKNGYSDLYVQEKMYAEKTNALFQDAVAFLMYHEFAHIYLEHFSVYQLLKKIPKNELTIGEYAEFIQMENDADRYAADMVLKKLSGEKQKLVSSLPVLMVMCSTIQILDTPMNIQQSSHPNVDNRLLHIIQHFGLNEEESSFYTKQYACFCITQFMFFYDHNISLKQQILSLKGEAYSEEKEKMENFKVNYKPSTHDTVEESLADLLEKLENHIEKQKKENDLNIKNKAC